jgi:hypothetical protein
MSDTTQKRGIRRLHRIRPRSALRTVVAAPEIKGMRSIPRWGRDQWEPLSEEQRIAIARARRLQPREPNDAE